MLARFTIAMLLPLLLLAGWPRPADAAVDDPAGSRPLSIAVLDFGETEAGRRAAEHVAAALARPGESTAKISVLDRGLSRAAARGIGYTGSLNMTLAEARDLGAAIGCDFYLTGDAQTLRRSPSTGPVFYEAYASVFIVSAQTGRLVFWERPSFAGATPVEAEKALLDELGREAHRYLSAILRALADERRQRAQEMARAQPVIEEAPEEESAAAAGFQPPQPYRRLRPPYPETAARAEAEATVDATVEVNADGEVGRVEIVRWAGFGLDEAVIATIRQMHFRPARRAGGETLPVRILLRYNFRRPPKSD